MLHRWFALILFASLFLGSVAWAQETQAAGTAPDNKAKANPLAQFPPDTPVVTLNGLCDSGLATATPQAVSEQALKAMSGNVPKGSPTLAPDCKTVITRERFEALAAAIGARPSKSQRLAYLYADILGFAGKGGELGVQQSPRFQEKMRYAYMQAMAQQGTVKLQEIADDFTDAEFQKFYKENPLQFVELRLSQLAIPKNKVRNDDAKGAPAPTKEQLAAEQEEMKKMAEKLQKELASGGNIDKLEERAYKAAHDDGVPDTDLGFRTPDQIPEQYRKMIFDLQEGGVSALAEDDHEYLVFKVIKRRIIAPDDEGRHHWGQLRMKEVRKQLDDTSKVQLNDKYFDTLKGMDVGSFPEK